MLEGGVLDRWREGVTDRVPDEPDDLRGVTIIRLSSQAETSDRSVALRIPLILPQSHDTGPTSKGRAWSAGLSISGLLTGLVLLGLEKLLIRGREEVIARSVLEYIV